MCFPTASAVYMKQRLLQHSSGFCLGPVPNAALLGPCAEFGTFTSVSWPFQIFVVYEGWQDLRSTWERSSGFCTVRVCAGSHPAKSEMKQCQSNVRCWDSPGIRGHMVVLAASAQCPLLALSCSPPFWFVHLHFSGCLCHGVPDHGNWMPFLVSVMGTSHSLQCHCLCWGQHQVPPSLTLLQRRQCPWFTLWNSVRLACLSSSIWYPVGS